MDRRWKVLRVQRCIILGSLLLCAAVGTACREDAQKPLVVGAASSLSEILPELVRAFAAQASGAHAHARFEFAGSQTLRAQLEHGAPLDVFISADPVHTTALQEAGLVHPAVEIFCNHLVLAVPLENPAGITRLEELPRASRIALTAPEVPLGALSEEVLARASAHLTPEQIGEIRRRVVTRDLSARQTLGRLAVKEADAALVFHTDALAASRDVRWFPLPPALVRAVPYTAAVVRRSSSKERAEAFVRFLGSADAAPVLQRAGFQPCPPREAAK